MNISGIFLQSLREIYFTWLPLNWKLVNKQRIGSVEKIKSVKGPWYRYKAEISHTVKGPEILLLSWNYSSLYIFIFTFSGKEGKLQKHESPLYSQRVAGYQEVGIDFEDKLWQLRNSIQNFSAFTSLRSRVRRGT